MKSINVVVVEGRLTDNCKIVNQAGTVCKFSIASNYSVKKSDGTWQDEVNFFNCVKFIKQGSGVTQYLTKGKQVVVSGELRQDRYTGKDGQKRSSVNIIVNDLQLCGENKQKQNVDNNSTLPTNDYRNDKTYQENNVPDNIPDSGIPF